MESGQKNALVRRVDAADPSYLFFALDDEVIRAAVRALFGLIEAPDEIAALLADPACGHVKPHQIRATDDPDELAIGTRRIRLLVKRCATSSASVCSVALIT